MNYLAHLYLSEPSEDGWLGSLLGDFVKGPLDTRDANGITRAIALHRKIDSFTDAHPIVLQSKARISAARRRYAGIMVDMFYDHFLARDWHAFHEEPLEVFSARIYALLAREHAFLPEKLQRIAPSMARLNWLASYAQLDSIHTALDRMGQRLRRANALLHSADELEEHYADMESDFRTFMPQVLQFALRQRSVAPFGLEAPPGTGTSASPSP